MPNWGFLTNHALVLLCIARDPGVRLRDIAASVGITERSAFGIVSDLAVAGYIVKEKGGRRNRYRVETQRPVPESADRYIAIGDLLALLGGQDVELFRKPVASFLLPVYARNAERQSLAAVASDFRRVHALGGANGTPPVIRVRWHFTAD